MVQKKKLSKTLIFGILATVFSFPPFGILGIISIIYYGKFETYTALDNPAKAIMAKEKARFWAITAILINIIIGIATWVCS